MVLIATGEHVLHSGLPDRPILGRPLYGVSLSSMVPEPRHDSELIEPRPQNFTESLRYQANRLREGEVGVENLTDVLWTARQIRGLDDGYGEVYFGPDGALTGGDLEDAKVVFRACDASSWLLPESEDVAEGRLTTEDFRTIVEVFEHYDGVCELEMEFELLERLNATRSRLCKELGVEKPSAFSLDQLAQKARRRLQLSKAVADGHFDVLFEDATPYIDDAQGGLPPQTQSVNEVSDPTVLEMPPDDFGDEPDVADLLNPSIEGRPIRSHRRRRAGRRDKSPVNKPATKGDRYRPHRKLSVRVAAAVATVALVASSLFVGLRSGEELRDSHSVTTQEEDPPPAPAPPTNPQPVQRETNTARMTYLGEYDQRTGVGTIWNIAENDVAHLGANLTAAQTYYLVDHYIKYMDPLVEGGMTWVRAENLPDEMRLPCPPLKTVNKWIADITGGRVTTPKSPPVQKSEPETVLVIDNAPAIEKGNSIMPVSKFGWALLTLNELRADARESSLVFPLAALQVLGKSYITNHRSFTRATDPRLLRTAFATARTIRDAFTGPW